MFLYFDQKQSQINYIFNDQKIRFSILKAYFFFIDLMVFLDLVSHNGKLTVVSNFQKNGGFRLTKSIFF